VTSSEFTLPDVGEGLTEAEIVAWKVKPGDEIIVNQVLVEIETAKSLVELPSPFAGTVTAILVAEGTTVDVGTPIISVSSGSSSGADDAVPTPEGTDTVAETAGSISPESSDAGGAVLVGYGIKGHVASRRTRPAAGSAATGAGSTSTASGIAASAPAIAPRCISAMAACLPAISPCIAAMCSCIAACAFSSIGC